MGSIFSNSPPPSSSSLSSSSSSSSEEDESISREQFNRAVRACGFPSPSSSVYRSFTEAIEKDDFTRSEAAMFLAQLIHESGGFQFTEEIDPPRGAYRDRQLDRPGQSYHGRGYIQLTWASNYSEASEDLFGDQRLLNRPYLVADDEDIAMAVSSWYWVERVRPEMEAHKNWFGLSTRAINGALECARGPPHPVAKRRYRRYLKVAEALGIRNKALEKGCYN